jgi:lactoylglutathione lyase
MTKVNHVGVCVTDLERSRRFYREALGFEPLRELQVPDAAASKLLRVEPPVGLTAAYLQRDGFVLELLHFDRPGNAPARERSITEPGLTHISLTVDDPDLTRARVVEHGGTVLGDTDVGVGVLVRDPDGQVLELLSPDALG